jgi:predicted secreted protein
MLHRYQDVNEDEFMVSEKILVAATLLNLNSKLSWARANIIAALDARQNGLAAASIPFTQLSTMLI